MTYGAALIAVACFAVAFDRLGVLPVARRAIRTGLEASRAMRNAALGDDEKERKVRAASLVLLGSFASITVRSAAAVAVSLAPLVVFHLSGVVDFSAVNHFLMSWPGVLLASGTVAALYGVRTRS